MKREILAVAAVLTLGILLATETDDAWARARSGGSRGSRSFSAPARPAPTAPTSPSRSLEQPGSPASPVASPRPGLFGGLMGGLAGFMLGGLLGSLLFGGLGHGLGIGLMDLLLVAGGAFLLWSFLKRRRAGELRPAYAMAGAPAGAAERTGGPEATAPAVPEVSDLDRGLGHIRQMDPRFDAARLAEQARAMFGEVQAAFAARDLGRVRDRLTREMYAELQAQGDRLRSAGRTNRVERIAVHRAEITEAWQEGGQDYVTVLLAASLVDYIVDDTTGTLVEGSKDALQEVEEFWTFTRPVGPNAWTLSAIQTP
jgi:predicted lipid-binding transport protein (Tim44 family)